MVAEQEYFLDNQIWQLIYISKYPKKQKKKKRSNYENRREKNTQTKIIVHIHRPIGTLRESFFDHETFLCGSSTFLSSIKTYSISIMYQTLTEMKTAVSVSSLKFANFSWKFGIYSCCNPHIKWKPILWNSPQLNCCHIRYSINILSKKCKNFVCIFYERKYADEM